MIAVDTNILVYAHRNDSREHATARTAIALLAEGPERWAVPWACIHEFLGIATHPRRYDPPSTSDEALLQVREWLRAPALSVLAEGPGYQEVLEEMIRSSGVTGPRVHDARIAALCIYHGVSELWTADRDFARFPRLRTRNPLVA